MCFVHHIIVEFAQSIKFFCHKTNEINNPIQADKSNWRAPHPAGGPELQHAMYVIYQFISKSTY